MWRSSYGRTGNGSSSSAPRARPAASELKKKQKEQFTMPMERRRHNILLLLLDDLRDATHLHKMASFHAISQRGVTFTMLMLLALRAAQAELHFSLAAGQASKAYAQTSKRAH